MISRLRDWFSTTVRLLSPFAGERYVGLQDAGRLLGLEVSPWTGKTSGLVRGIPVLLTSTYDRNASVVVEDGLSESPLEAKDLGDVGEVTSGAIVAAVERLVATAEATQYAACEKARTGTTPFYRRDAVRRLGTIATKSERVLNQLEASMKDVDLRVRLAAAVALGRAAAVFAASDENALLEIATGFDSTGRIEAANVLSAIGTANAIPRLASARAEGGPSAAALAAAIEAIGHREHRERGDLALATPAGESGQLSVSAPKGALSKSERSS